jgi:polyisoprenoid-binding protein YceI
MRNSAEVSGVIVNNVSRRRKRKTLLDPCGVFLHSLPSMAQRLELLNAAWKNPPTARRKCMPYGRRVAATIIMLASLVGVGRAFAADVYKTDTAHTLVGFTVRHFVINKVRGKFNEFDGHIVYDESDITRSSMRGTIKVASIDTDNQERDEHLRSADFFDAVNHPEITFVSKRVEKRGNGQVLIGDLTIRGTSKEVTIPFAITGKIDGLRGETVIGFEATLQINRKDFGVAYHRLMDNGGLVVGDTVDIELIGEAIEAE